MSARAARDVLVGESWAFRDHPSLAEIDRKMAVNRGRKRKAPDGTGHHTREKDTAA